MAVVAVVFVGRFFFLAEDGIRDGHVTGVQTCALPITGIILLTIFGPLLVEVAFQFGPAEYFSLMFLGLLAASTLSSGSPLKGISMVLVGLIFGVVGTDVNTGVARFTFNVPELQDGLALIAVAMGLFGIADVIANANRLGSGSIISRGRIGMRDRK